MYPRLDTPNDFSSQEDVYSMFDETRQREYTSHVKQDDANGEKMATAWERISVLTLRAPSQISYTVQTVTGDLPGAGTAAAVFITLHGSKGDSRRIQLSNSEFWV
jgi:hypothetical protein